MTKRLKLKQGWGGPGTKLGTLLRNEGRLFDAEESYLDALRIRTKTFGPNSAKVEETLSAYEALLREENRVGEAELVHRRCESIDHLSAVPQGTYDWLSASLLVLATLFVWKRGRLLVYCSKIPEKQDRLSA
jgi:hypothetical protein